MPRKRKVMMPRGAIQQKAEWSGSRGSYLTAIPNLAKDKMAEKDKKEYISEAVDSFIKSRGLRLEPASKDRIVYYIIRDFVGYGPVDVLMADLRIEDVSCDGTAIPLFIFHQKYE